METPNATYSCQPTLAWNRDGEYDVFQGDERIGGVRDGQIAQIIVDALNQGEPHAENACDECNGTRWPQERHEPACSLYGAGEIVVRHDSDLVARTERLGRMANQRNLDDFDWGCL